MEINRTWSFNHCSIITFKWEYIWKLLSEVKCAKSNGYMNFHLPSNSTNFTTNQNELSIKKVFPLQERHRIHNGSRNGQNFHDKSWFSYASTCIRWIEMPTFALILKAFSYPKRGAIIVYIGICRIELQQFKMMPDNKLNEASRAVAKNSSYRMTIINSWIIYHWGNLFYRLSRRKSPGKTSTKRNRPEVRFVLLFLPLLSCQKERFDIYLVD